MKNWLIYVVLGGDRVWINIHASQSNLEMAIYLCTKISKWGKHFCPECTIDLD